MTNDKIAWLVDDDEEMSTAISLMLKMMDYKTRSFLDAPKAAQALLEGQDCHLVLLDLNMPQVSGRDFLEFLRQRVEFDKLPVVMLSSEFNEFTMNELLKLGADAYITKPVSLAELQAAVNQAAVTRAAGR